MLINNVSKQHEEQMETIGFETRSLFIGKEMQSIEVQTTHGIKKIPADYQRKWIILICHPGDFTLTCLEYFYAFAIRVEEFKKLNTELIGISIDENVCNIKCTQWLKQKLKMNIPFPIITDCLGYIETIRGLIHPANKVRVVSIIDMEGLMRLMIYYPKTIDMKVDDILGTINTLQISDCNKAALIKSQPNIESIIQ